MVTNKLEGIVRSLLTDRFPDAKIDGVVIKADTDNDGDRILRITVVVASAMENLDRDSLFGFARLLQPKLEAAESDEFPVMSFIAAREVGKMKLEAA